jgi:predicted enzyme related to lactoylglutathione lyase
MRSRMDQSIRPQSRSAQGIAAAVGFFLHVEDFDAAYARMASAGVAFVTAPRMDPYGQVAVFLNIAGNKWDLIGPAPQG